MIKVLLQFQQIMFKFTPKEAILLQNNVPVALVNIIIPCDVPVIMLANHVLGASLNTNLPGYADACNSWTV